MTGQSDHAECETILTLLPEFALGLLDGAEAITVRRHVRLCVPCRGELGSYQQVADALLIVPAPVPPSPELRRRVLLAAGIAADSTASPLKTRTTLGGRLGAILRPSPILPRLSPAFAFIALAIALGLGYRSMLLQTELDQARVANSTLQSDLASQGQLIADVLRPDVTVWPLRPTESASSARATLYCNPDRQTGILTASELPPLPGGQVYQLWLIRDGQRTSGGLLSVDSRGAGVLTITAPEPFSAYQSVGMTVEPVGGSAGPTGSRVLSGYLY
jgi:hypothetical protein